MSTAKTLQACSSLIRVNEVYLSEGAKGKRLQYPVQPNNALTPSFLTCNASSIWFREIRQLSIALRTNFLFFNSLIAISLFFLVWMQSQVSDVLNSSDN